MLSLVTAKEIRPEAETVDRDPGIVSLIAAVVRSGARAVAATLRSVRALNQRVNEAEPFSSWSAWRCNHRSH